MAFVDLYGNADIAVNWPFSQLPQIENVRLDYLTEDEIGVLADIGIDGLRSGYVTYRGDFSTSSDGSITGNLTGFDVGTFDGYTNVFVDGVNLPLESLVEASGIEAIRSLEASLFTGDDFLDGSIDGGSVVARLGDGNDSAIISSGLFNDVNGNQGNDYFRIEGGSGRIRGGKGSDVVDITGGQYDAINGNNGNDIITNWSEFAGNVRGGQGDDLIIGAGGGMYAYGDLGRDTFKPYVGSSMIVMDYQPGYDSVDLSALGSNYNIVTGTTGLLIGVGSEVVVALEGAFSL